MPVFLNDDTISRFRYYSLVSKGTSEFAEEHKQIVLSLKAGESERAVPLLHRHLIQPKHLLTEQFSKGNITRRAN